MRQHAGIANASHLIGVWPVFCLLFDQVTLCYTATTAHHHWFEGVQACDVAVSYLPVGSEMASKWYVEQALEPGCALVNWIPFFIESQPYWRRRFKERGRPIVGGDIKSQLGVTITHQMLAHLFDERGVHLDRPYQLNSGGNTDFLNMLERERLESQRISRPIRF